MSGQALAGRKYLVVEDEYLIASDLLMTLEDEGERVFGPVSDVREPSRFFRTLPFNWMPQSSISTWEGNWFSLQQRC